MHHGNILRISICGLWYGSVRSSDQCGPGGKKSADRLDEDAGGRKGGRKKRLERDDEPPEGRGDRRGAYLFQNPSGGGKIFFRRKGR